MKPNEWKKLEPPTLWEYFEKLNTIPRASKKEERASAYLKEFGDSLGLSTLLDERGNVLIKKPASAGYEKCQTVVLQGHLDMVQQKNKTTDFNFDEMGIRSYIDGEWLKAEGTTLGADNGIGVAAIMTVLASDSIAHPALEALFTTDEESGMSGAMGLEPNLLSGRLFFNLDTEEIDRLCIGSAGGFMALAQRRYPEVSSTQGSHFKLAVKGLFGGHSGIEIALGRGNANQILGRLLFCAEEYGLRLSSAEGGGLHNAIPREAHAIFTVDAGREGEFKAKIKSLSEEIYEEYRVSDPDQVIELLPVEQPQKVLEKEAQRVLLNSWRSLPNGVYRMSPTIENFVETSSNFCWISIKEGACEMKFSIRSSLPSSGKDLGERIEALLKLAEVDVDFTDGYPAWLPKPTAPIVSILNDASTKIRKEPPLIYACHAGLECSIIGVKYPEMQMISFGPTIESPHSPDEKVHIPSVKIFWDILLEALKNIP